MIVDLMDTAAKAIMGLALDGHVNNNDEETSKTEPTVKKRSPEDQIKIFQDLTKSFNDLIEVCKYINKLLNYLFYYFGLNLIFLFYCFL